MTSPVRFVYEQEFELQWDAYFTVTYCPDHPKARVEQVTARAERDISGKVTRWVGVLLVRDASSAAHPMPKTVVIVRKAGRMTELPPEADELIGTFTSDRGETEWYAYSGRPAQPAAQSERQGAGSTRPAASPPPSAPPRRDEESTRPQAPEASDWLSSLS